jgi:hypothetical protein
MVKLAGKPTHGEATVCFYTVLDSPRAGVFKVHCPFVSLSKPRLILGGRHVAHGQVVELQKGLYPLLVMFRGSCKGTQPPFAPVDPRLDAATEEDIEKAKADLPARETEYKEQLKDWEFDLAEVGHYALNASGPPARYAAAHRNVFGENASPYDDVTHFVPRKMFAYLYRPDGKPIAQDINGAPDVSAGFFASLFPVVPEQWKPAVLWGWDFHAGKDDFILQAFLKAYPIHGWNAPNGGTFRMLGLGHVWAHGPNERERCRWDENVVMLPEDEINEGGCARLTYLKTGKDGSGILAMDMSEIYADSSSNAVYEMFGGGRRAERIKPSGISGLRSIAKADGATLQGTFIAPAKARLQAEARTVKFYNSHSGNITRVIPGVFASGADPRDGDFSMAGRSCWSRYCQTR